MILKNIDRYFPVFLLAGVVFGFAFPNFLQQFEGLVIYMVMFIMVLLYMRVEIIDVLFHVRNPLFVFYISLISLIIIPVLTFFLFGFLDQESNMALVLLAALPAGVTATAFTDIMKGKTSLTLTIVIITNLLATVTIPLLFLVLFKTNLDLDIKQLFFSLLQVMFIPLIIAKILKLIFVRKLSRMLRDYYNVCILFLMACISMVTIAFQAVYIMENFRHLIEILLILFVAFFLFQMVGYFSVFWKKQKGTRLAVSNSTMIMNNTLGVVLSIAFFPQSVTTIMILSFIPWSLMIVLKHWYKKYLP